jgi:hypothetical protein
MIEKRARGFAWFGTSTGQQRAKLLGKIAVVLLSLSAEPAALQLTTCPQIYYI